MLNRFSLWSVLAIGFIEPQYTWAQDSTAYPIFQQMPTVVSVNRENLIQRSDYGKALIETLVASQQKLRSENDTLLLELEDEERKLTELRKTMAAEDFAPLAEAFDVKVKSVRRLQDQKGVELTKALEAARFRFFRQSERIISQLMKENGIVFVLDANAIWISQGGDVTNLVIERLNDAYKAGELTLE